MAPELQRMVDEYEAICAAHRGDHCAVLTRPADWLDVALQNAVPGETVKGWHYLPCVDKVSASSRVSLVRRPFEHNMGMVSL